MDNKPEVIDPSELLTLCMPTYNRVVNVCEALEDIIPKIKPYNFRLIVVDNCSPTIPVRSLRLIRGYMIV